MAYIEPNIQDKELESIDGQKDIESNIEDSELESEIEQEQINSELEDNYLEGEIEKGEVLNPREFVPYIDALRDVDLGEYSLTSYDLYVKNRVCIGATCVTDDPAYLFQFKGDVGARGIFATDSGYATYTFQRNDVDMGYIGLGSLTNNNMHFATYSGSNAGLKYITLGVDRFYIDPNGSAWYGWVQSNDLFSIGLDPDLNTILAKLHIRDNRDGSEDRDQMILEHYKTWSTKSNFVKGINSDGTMFKITKDGKYCQRDSDVVTTTDDTPTELMRFSLLNNRRYSIKFNIIAKQSGNNDMLDHQYIETYKRYLPGDAIKVGATTEIHKACENSDYDSYTAVAGGDVVVYVVGKAGQTVVWKGYIDFHYNS
jgi:hypothetical protein